MSLERALLGVYDKTGIVAFATGLAELGIEILSTGGTARVLRDGGVDVREVADFTGHPEMMGGRVKTLHPRVHGGILARRDDESHLADLARVGGGPIDLVAVNLYPFEATIAREEATFEDCIEQIDIGGPTMLRAAAKNHSGVIVVSAPSQYDQVLEALQSGGVNDAARRGLALEAFRMTAAYDAAISTWLASQPS